MPQEPRSDASYDVIPPARFDFLTPVFDLCCRVGGLGGAFRDSIVDHLDLAPGQRVLDMGCGTGVLATRIKERFPSVAVAGVDPTRSALRAAVRRSAAGKLDIEWREGVAESLPWEDCSFDRVVTSLVLHHIPAEAKVEALRGCLRVLRPGGFLLLADFSEADTLGGRLWLRLIRGFEHNRGQLGRVPQLLAEAGFDRPRRVHQARLGIGFHVGHRSV